MAFREKNSPAAGLILIAVAIFLALSLFSYHPGDAGHARPPGPVFNFGGRVGALLSLYVFLAVGWAGYFIPLLMLGEGINRLVPRKDPPRPFWIRMIQETAIILSLAAIFSIQTTIAPGRLGWQLENIGLGGYWGRLSSSWLLKYLGVAGTRLVLVSVLSIAACLLTEMKPVLFLINQFRRLFNFFVSLSPGRRRIKVTPPAAIPARKQRARPEPVAGDLKSRRKLEREMQKIESEKKELQQQRALLEQERKEKEERRRRVLEKKKKKEKKKTKQKKPPPVPAPAAAAVSSVSVSTSSGPYKLPSTDLLLTPPPLSERSIEDDIEVNSEILESTLLDFGIEAKVVGAERGPAITRYEIQPAPGVKVGKIKALDNDIALAMKATSVRILAPIPGKAALGIEVPNSTTTLVYMREMIESEEYQKGSARLPLALGKDISGRPIVSDLTEMPHLLIAGATGSGKTVCMNSVIISLIFSRTPDEMRIILVDPKKVEMSAFHRLPHLICPVITDASKTSLALAWLVKEMENRYEIFAEAGVRNIEGYNQRKKAERSGEDGEKLPESFPYIILFIDELADLMLTAPAEIENAIARLAHLSRAVGIHMILATQRPSVDVITGVIKANFPARISFQVAARVDSRTVLDAGGADKLLGNGDLLFLPPGSSRMLRAQGTLCQDSEIDGVVAFLTRQAEPQFVKDIFKKAAAAQMALGGGEDILLEAAVEVIKQTQQASVSILQRKLKIGYSRASRIMDILEERGVVGPYQGTKARDILIETYAGEGFAEGGEEEEAEGDEEEREEE